MTKTLTGKRTTFYNGDVFELDFEFDPTKHVLGTCNKVFEGSDISQEALKNVDWTPADMDMRVEALRKAIYSGKVLKTTDFCSSLPKTAPARPVVDVGSSDSTYASSDFI